MIDINLIFVASYLSKIFVDTYLNKRLCGATTLIILKILTSSQNIPLARPTLRSVNDVTEGIAQESPMGDSWVIPIKVDKMVLPTTRQGRALLIGRIKRWVIPG